MKKLAYEWVLREEQAETEERYCAHCGRKALFRDSMMRRVNANGKDLYEFAIFKCERDHTWNKALGTTKAKAIREEIKQVDAASDSRINMIDLEFCVDQGIQVIEISLKKVTGKCRLDKLLAQQIKGWSRSRIEALIEDGTISVEGRNSGAKTFVKTGDLIRISLLNQVELGLDDQGDEERLDSEVEKFSELYQKV